MKYTEILTRIRQIIRSVNLESKRIEKEYGISIPQLLCLNFLLERENKQASHKQIKDFLQLNASTVTGIIDRLEKKNLVIRLPKQQDRRVGMISITEKGLALIAGTPEPLHQQLSDKLKKLSPDQLKELQSSFDIIINFLNIEDVKAAPIITAGTDVSKSDPMAP